MLRFTLRVTRGKDKVKNEHIRGTLKVDRFGHKVRDRSQLSTFSQ